MKVPGKSLKIILFVKDFFFFFLILFSFYSQTSMMRVEWGGGSGI